MSAAAPVLRTLHDVGLAAWFGGGLMGAVGVNSTARRTDNLSDRHQLAVHPWERWAPVNATAVGLHVAGAAGLLVTGDATRSRPATVAKVGLTAAAVGLTVMAERRADVVERQVEASGEGPDEPGNLSPGDFAHAQDQLRVLRWSVTALTGSLLTLSAVHGRA